MNKLSDYSTKDIHEELTRRVGVHEIQIPVENEVKIFDKFGEVMRISGPARILVNID